MRLLSLTLMASAALISLTAGGQAAMIPGCTVIDLNRNTTQDTWTFGAAQDVCFIGPSTARTKAVRTVGGRKIGLYGGKFAPVYGVEGAPIAAFSTKEQSAGGEIVVDGVSMDLKNAKFMDGIVLNQNGSTAIPAKIVNSTITNVYGTQDGKHADIVQPQGRIRTLTMENVIGSTYYQGLFLARQEGVAYGGKAEAVVLKNVALSHATPDAAHPVKPQCYYLASFGGSQTVSMTNVSVTKQPYRTGCSGGSTINLGGARVSGQAVEGTAATGVTGSGAGLSSGSSLPGAPVVSPQVSQDTEWMQGAIRGLAGQGYTQAQIQQTFQQYGYQIGGEVIDTVLTGVVGSETDVGRQLAGLVGGDLTGMTGYLDSRGLGELIDTGLDYVQTGNPQLDAILQRFARGNSGPGGTMCSSVAMDAVMAAGSAAAGVFTGGRATVVAQFAQQIQLLQANMCSGVTNDHLNASNKNETLMIDYMIQMLKGTDWTNQYAAVNSMAQMAGIMVNSGQVYSMAGIAPDYGRAYPQTYGAEKTNQDIIWESNSMMDRQRQTQIAAQRQQAQSADMIRKRPQRVSEIMSAARTAPGPTAVGQEQIKMDALLVESVTAMHADQIAAERARLNEMARQQQDRALEEKAFENAFKGWGDCARCGKATMMWTANERVRN